MGLRAEMGVGEMAVWTVNDSMPLPACPQGHFCTVSANVTPGDLLVLQSEHEWRFYRRSKDGEKCEPVPVVGCWSLFSVSPR